MFDYTILGILACLKEIEVYVWTTSLIIKREITGSENVCKFEAAKDYQGCNLLHDNNMLKLKPWLRFRTKSLDKVYEKLS